MNSRRILILLLFAYSRIDAQETISKSAATGSMQPNFQVLSESTVQQRDGCSITFRQVAPPVITAQVRSSAVAPVLGSRAVQETEQSQLPVKESKVIGVSASVHANGVTVLHWNCGESQRLHAVTNVDFRNLEGLGSWETVQSSYMLILNTGLDEEALTDAEAWAAKSLPTNGGVSFALVNGTATVIPADEAALDAMESLLIFFDTHREDLVKLQAQRADRVAAASAAPRPPPRHSIVHFWPLQPRQRFEIQEHLRREAEIKEAERQKASGMIKGGTQP